MLGFGALGQFPLGGELPASGSTTSEDRWHQPWSLPVPRRDIGAQNRQFTAFQFPIIPSFAWWRQLDIPVRNRPIDPAALAPFAFMYPFPLPRVIFDWDTKLSEPKRIIESRYVLNKFFFYEPNFPSPPPDVTGVMSAFETDTDAAIIVINVLQSGPAASAKVSIYEISGGNSATSIRER